MEQDESKQQTQEERRNEIMKVQRDSSLTMEEKMRKIQEIMSRSWQKVQSTKIEPTQDQHSAKDLEQTYHDSNKTILGCKHYQRGCKIQAACCSKLFPCRLCHDDVSDHPIDRHATQNMLCMHCSTIQPIQQNCSNPSCSKQMARYYCPICKFHDNDERKSIFHCDGCGICRIGKGLGIDTIHCDKCGICYGSGPFKNHKCSEFKSVLCPICQKLAFDNPFDGGSFLPCNHAMHSSCLSKYLTSGHRSCPLCHKSISKNSIEDRYYARLLTMYPMPEEYKNMVAHILCNDCDQKMDVKYHFNGNRCSKCGCFNTTLISTRNRNENEVLEGEGQEPEEDEEEEEGEQAMQEDEDPDFQYDTEEEEEQPVPLDQQQGEQQQELQQQGEQQGEEGKESDENRDNNNQ